MAIATEYRDRIREKIRDGGGEREMLHYNNITDNVNRSPICQLNATTFLKMF